MFSFSNTKPATSSPLAQSTSQFVFGGTPQQKPSIFGQTTSQQQNQPTNSLFGQTIQNQPQQQSSLFGLSSTPQQGSLLGQSAQTPQTSLFGNTQQISQSGTGSLFGQPQQNQSSLFGQSQQQNAQPSLLGQSTNQKPQGSLFGQSTAPLGMQFSQSSAPQGSLFGQSQAQNNQNQAQQIPLMNNTRYTELNDDQQKFLDNLYQAINTQISLAEDLKSRRSEIASLVNSVPVDVAELLRRLSRVLINSEANKTDLAKLRSIVDADFSCFEMCARQIQSLQNPYQTTTDSDEADPVFSLIAKHCDSIETKTTNLRGLIKNMEQYLDEIENDSTEQTYQGISSSMITLQEEFLLLSNNVAELHDEINTFVDKNR